MIAVDSSALIEVVARQRLAAECADALLSDELVMSAATLTESHSLAARNNGRDVAFQNGSRWRSHSPLSAVPMAFAARSISPEETGVYEWLVTSGTSISWFDGDQLGRP